jgi:hypothetical protein
MRKCESVSEFGSVGLGGIQSMCECGSLGVWEHEKV